MVWHGAYCFVDTPVRNNAIIFLLAWPLANRLQSSVDNTVFRNGRVAKILWLGGEVRNLCSVF